MARPLHALYSIPGGTRKNADVRPYWTIECQNAFENLKTALTSAPVLGFADFNLPFVLEVDASLQGLGAIISQVQDGKSTVIAYASRGLSKTERKYDEKHSSRKLELLALKWAIANKFRNYLLGNHFTVWTDNSPLSHLTSAKLGVTEQRWVGELGAFDFKIQYKSGKSNANADCLSRHPLPPIGTKVNEELPTEPPVIDNILHPGMSHDTVQHCAVQVSSDQSEHTDEFSEVINYLLDESNNSHSDHVTYQGETRELLREKKRLKVIQGRLYREAVIDGDETVQRVIPRAERLRHLQLAHDYVAVAHLGPERRMMCSPM